MTAIELLKTQIDSVGGQLERSFGDLPDAEIDKKPLGSAMSFREQIVHLCEVYTAVVTEAAGGKHSWGTYQPPTHEWGGLKTTFTDLRQKAVSAVTADDATIETASQFIVGHDNYHVGQMVVIRLALQPDWNSYSIYGD